MVDVCLVREQIEDHVLSPELVLVCPALRQSALRRLPDRDPDGFLPKRTADDAWEQLLKGLRAGPEREDVEDRLSVGKAVGAYAALQCIHMAVYAVVAIATVSSLVLLLSYARHG